MEKYTIIKNPLTVIAIFASLTEIVCGTVTPYISDLENQRIFLIFVIAFPILLIILFFATLNFNHKVLYSPSDFSESNDKIAELFYGKSSKAKDISNIQSSQSVIKSSFDAFDDELADDKEQNSVRFVNVFLHKLDSLIPKHKLKPIFYKQFNSFIYLIDIEINDEYRVDLKESRLPFILSTLYIKGGKIIPSLAGCGVNDNGDGEQLISYILNKVNSSCK